MRTLVLFLLGTLLLLSPSGMAGKDLNTVTDDIEKNRVMLEQAVADASTRCTYVAGVLSIGPEGCAPPGAQVIPIAPGIYLGIDVSRLGRIIGCSPETELDWVECVVDYLEDKAKYEL